MGRSPIRVLLIEDEETDYLLTRRVLSSVANQSYDVEWAGSWGAGIEAIRRCAHDVCLLDFRIGGGDGLELLKESRDIGCKAPVILLTGIHDHRLDVEAMELGAADFLVKDKITPELMERAIRYSIAQAESLDELQRQRDELHASELQFRSVVQSAGDAIILANEAGNIVGWNNGAEAVFGYSEDEILGANLQVLMPETYREAHRAGFERFRVTGRSELIGKTRELEGLRKDGAVFPLELSLASWRNGAGIMFTGIVRDITERRRTEELHHAKEAAEQANLAKSNFVASMSHELRTPLHAIIGFTNLMLRNKAASLSRQEQDFLQRILSNAKDQLQLINGILDLSRVEAGRMELRLGDIAIDGLISDVVRQLEGKRRNPEVDLVVRVPDVIAPVQGDPARLKQVLLNLIENALKFTSHGSVTIVVDINPINLRPIRIDVRDTGIGIAPDRLQDIFEPFRQVEVSTRPKEGSGLGLSICRSLCELMGYRLEVRSTPGDGSTFSIILEADTRQLPLSA
jgi:two-component system, sensor histidine kinase and response regulator